jgi:alpha-L-fucosidase
MTGYGEIDILWLDAGQVRPPAQDLRMDELAAMARRHQPRLIIVDRTVGGRYENYRTPEQEVPEQPLPYVWESCVTMGTSWSYKPADKYKSTHQLIHLLVDIVGKGGNLLLNVGPQPDGELPPEAVLRMKEVGAWMSLNGEAIYGTRPVKPCKEGDIVFTLRGKTAYAISLAKDGEEGPPAQLSFSSLKPAPGSTARLLGVDQPLVWRTDAAGKTIMEMPASAREAPPCRHAFVVKLQI